MDTVSRSCSTQRAPGGDLIERTSARPYCRGERSTSRVPPIRAPVDGRSHMAAAAAAAADTVAVAAIVSPSWSRLQPCAEPRRPVGDVRVRADGSAARASSAAAAEGARSLAAAASCSARRLVAISIAPGFSCARDRRSSARSARSARCSCFGLPHLHTLKRSARKSRRKWEHARMESSASDERRALARSSAARALV